MSVGERMRWLARRASAVMVATALLTWFAAALPGTAAAQTGFNDFNDIRGHWSESFVRTLLYTGVLSVPEDGRFRPDDPVTRLDFAVWLAGAMELQPASGTAQAPFSDWSQVPEEARPKVLAAVEAGLLNGFPDGTFRPDEVLTRAQMGVIFGRALIPLGYTPEDRYRAVFVDGDQIPAWASDATAAVKARVIQGTYVDGVFAFHPYAATTRGEAATMIVRFVEIRIEVLGIPRPEPRQVTTGRVARFAYYIDDTNGYQMLQQYGEHLDALILWNYHLENAGGGIAGLDRRRVMTWAVDTGKPLIALITAHDRSINDAFLANPEAHDDFIRNLQALLDKGFSGIDLNFENVSAARRDNLTELVRRVSAAVKARGAHISISVPAKTGDDPASDWSGAYDYAALGGLVDHVAVMTYDYSWNGGAAGPIGPIGWMRRVLDYAVTRIPAGKILLGLPAYGRDWPAGAVGGGRALTARQIDELTAKRGITPAYDAATGEATFNYIDDQGVARVVWFTPPEGVAAKLSLVDEYGLGGFVMWRMGQEVDGYWTAITRALP